MKEIFGEISCWIVKFAVVSICLKQVLGGFFMAFYRIICMKRPDIALNLNKQRHIRNQLLVLELTTLIFLSAIELFGTKMRGTSSILAVCRGNSMSMDHILHLATGTTQWEISVGTKFQMTTMVYCQLFIILELVIYIILFVHIYCHNEKLMNGNQLGLSKDTLKKRKTKNVITLFGQFLSFVIETIATIILSVYLSIGFVFPPLHMFIAALLTASFFLSSPELKRFYFNQ